MTYGVTIVAAVIKRNGISGKRNDASKENLNARAAMLQRRGSIWAVQRA